MIDEEFIVRFFVGVLNDPHRKYAFKDIARLKYAYKELRFEQLGQNQCRVTLSKYGFEYKHRGKRPKEYPEVNTDRLAAAINNKLPAGYYIVGCVDEGPDIIITLFKMEL